MLKNRLLDSIVAILPAIHNQVSPSFSAFTGIYGRRGLAWNIRVDETPKNIAPADKAIAFQHWLERNADDSAFLFSAHCETALSAFLADVEQFARDVESSSNLDRPPLDFDVEGRNGGWLVLRRWTTVINGYSVTFEFDGEDLNSAEGARHALRHMSRSTLIKFRKIIRRINAGVSVERRREIAADIANAEFEAFEEDVAAA